MNSGVQRLRAVYSALDRDQRFAAGAAIALLLAMFLPWYEKSVVIPGSRSFATDSISAFGAVSFVEAAIFLVSAGVLTLLLARAEGRPFHLPGGDGTVIFAAGIWATLLIFYRVFDRPDISGDGGTVGIQWGFFVAFVAAGALAVAGQRIRAAGRPEPQGPATPPRRERERPRAPVPASPPAPTAATDIVPFSEPPTAVVPASEAHTGVVPTAPGRPRDRRVTREDAEQLTFDDPAGDRDRDDDEPPLRPGEIPRRARDR